MRLDVRLIILHARYRMSIHPMNTKRTAFQNEQARQLLVNFVIDRRGNSEKSALDAICFVLLTCPFFEVKKLFLKQNRYF